MKKNILFVICLLILSLSYQAYAQEGVTNCGSVELNGDTLEGNAHLVSSPELICLGEKILTENSQTKIFLNTDSAGEMEFYIERSEGDTLVGKISFGDEGEMSEENKIYANTFYSCPTTIEDINLNQGDVNLADDPGTIALWSYLTISSLINEPVTNNCVGTYFTVDDDSDEGDTGVEENQTEEIGEEDQTEEVQEEIIEYNNQDFSLDKRKTFSQILDEDRLANIQDQTDLVLQEQVGCEEDDISSQNKCAYYFKGEDTDQFNNPIINLSINLWKQNEKVNDVFSLYQSIIEAVNFYNSLVNNYKNNGYLDSSDKIEIDSLESDYYTFLESEDKRLLFLKDSWIIEMDFTQGVSIDYLLALSEEIIAEIDDLAGVNMSALQAFDEEMKLEESQSGSGENMVEPGEENIQEGEMVSEDMSQENENNINMDLFNRLQGKIILKVEDEGKAYYVDPVDKGIYYLGKPEDAFSVMRDRGIGIKTGSLKKIPIGLIDLSGPDDDGDGLSNIFEDAMSTDKNNRDMDGDSYSDRDEIEGGYSPYGEGRLVYDNNFTRQQLGKIFLQVENNGEAWYVNPEDSKRYFLGRPQDAFNIMRTLGLGISNNDFARLGTVAN